MAEPALAALVRRRLHAATATLDPRADQIGIRLSGVTNAQSLYERLSTLSGCLPIVSPRTRAGDAPCSHRFP